MFGNFHLLLGADAVHCMGLLKALLSGKHTATTAAYGLGLVAMGSALYVPTSSNTGLLK